MSSTEASTKNIDKAKEEVQAAVKQQEDQFAEAVHLGTMTEDEVKEQHDSGVYAYQFLIDGDDYVAVWQISGQDVQQKKLTPQEARIWHPTSEGS